MNRPITLRTLLLTNGLTLLAVVAIIVSTPTFARTLAQITTATTPPATVPYQGTLTDASGTPINDSVAMTFKLYAAPSGGTALWTEQRTGANAVPVTNGLFSVALGQVTPIPAEVLAQPLWLGISVNGDAEMTPREAVALPAMAATVPDGSITSAKLTTMTNHLADGNHVPLVGGNKTTTLSTFTLENQPAGDVVVYLTLYGYKDSADVAGSVHLVIDGKGVGTAPLHTLTERFSPIVFHGRLADFKGGTLTIRVDARTESQSTAQVSFGFRNNDPRFGRFVTVMTGW
ncbi:MAG: hypothetical protein HC911_15705 [Chloroflexaceae bacterium]|nr:hypothetical protein [Chloroflexaceae bacterium]